MNRLFLLGAVLAVFLLSINSVIANQSGMRGGAVIVILDGKVVMSVDVSDCNNGASPKLGNKVVVYDQQGNVIAETSTTNSTATVSIQGFSPGTYRVVFINGDCCQARVLQL